ncbi:hypothetical protein H5410_016446 [Solanum commersonii]|uniref:DUF7610 domain-containing protein n=1 Tax=Solanum commersonii TaxID=4109 RepID=A0A9J5ZWE9_SOLCO|nr:hypothetical protein H5410_016446 [Solanum commersonii]
MTKRYGILRKKLEKLESDLHLLFAFPSDSETHEILSHAIEQQLEFLNHLLAAEITSSPSKPRHLYHIGRRLNELETVFDLHSQQQLDGNNMNDHDAASVCSCSESCINDDGEAAVERDFGDSTVNYEDSPVVDVKGVEEVDGEEQAFGIEVEVAPEIALAIASVYYSIWYLRELV